MTFTPEQYLELAILNKTRTIQAIARYFALPPETIRKSLHYLGLKGREQRAKDRFDAPETVAPQEDALSGVSFEDHPNADRDRHLGRRARRAETIVPSQSSAGLAVK
jgi:hypothetical protein